MKTKEPAKVKKPSITVKDLKARKNPKGGLNPQPEPPMGKAVKLDGLQALKIGAALNLAADHKGALLHK